MNTLIKTDVYKFGHQYQYPPGTNKVYSYLEARGLGRGVEHINPNKIVFFGLQYYLKEYLSKPITQDHVTEWAKYYKRILGVDADLDKMNKLANLGYWPIRIKAVPEGTIMPTKQAMMTITNTLPEFYWCVNYLETLLMKIWSPITVATNSLEFKTLFKKFADETCDDDSIISFQMHDFGYRGVSSEETAAITGAAHLTSFLGTDTVAGIKMLDDYYYGEQCDPVGLSVPASEHSVMCSWSEDNDDELAIENMLKLYPDGIVSIVSDSYDLWKTITDMYGGTLRWLVEKRNGKTVVRPDSGLPEYIICGNPNEPADSPAGKGVIRLLDEQFGHTVNSKGYKVLNPTIGCIYGDAITYERAKLILSTLKDMGYASSSTLFGSGGLLLNNWSRDSLKMAIKATYCEVDGKSRPIEKRPVTDSGKTSKKGLLRLEKDEFGWYTKENCTSEGEGGLMEVVFENGKLLKEYTLTEIRDRINEN